jgi:prevent-host-death family protein
MWSYWEAIMNTMQLRDAKANLSKLVDAAERGEATTITRHGKEVAVLVPVEDANAIAAAKLAVSKAKPNFVEFLMTFPVDLNEALPDSERPNIRDIDL